MPYVDSRAGDLRWSWGDADHARAALACLLVDRGPVVLELRLLGSSHQVVVHVGGRTFSETVACAVDRPGPLPDRSTRDDGCVSYRFRSRASQLTRARFEEAVEALVARLGPEPDSLVGRYPGAPHSVTAVTLGRTGDASWRTVHTYPQDAVVVTTATRLWLSPRTAP